MGFVLDTSVVQKQLKVLVDNAMPKAVKGGMARAGMALMNDSIMVPPTAPLWEGTLRGSFSVFVDGRLIYATPGGTPNKRHAEIAQRNTCTAVVGVNTPYAARLHEHPEYAFKTPGSGGKFIEAKLKSRENQYITIVRKFLETEVFKGI